MLSFISMRVATIISADYIFLILCIYDCNMYSIIILDFTINRSAGCRDKFNKSMNDDLVIKHIINEIISYLVCTLVVCQHYYICSMSSLILLEKYNIFQKFVKFWKFHNWKVLVWFSNELYILIYNISMI